MRKLASASFAIALLAFAAPAAAQDDVELTKDTWPLAVNDRPLTLVAGMLEIGGDTLRVNMSKDLVGDPILVSPSIYYGVNHKLTVGVYHQNSICVAGDLCDKAYNDITLDALYGIMTKGSFLLAAHGGWAFQSLDPLVGGVNLGFQGWLTVGKIAIVFDPRLYVGALERDTMKEFVSVPVWVRFQLNPQTNVYATSGIYGPLDGFGDVYSVPVGLGAVFAVSNRLDIGGEFLFANLAGKGSTADARWLIVRAALRL